MLDGGSIPPSSTREVLYAISSPLQEYGQGSSTYRTSLMGLTGFDSVMDKILTTEASGASPLGDKPSK